MGPVSVLIYIYIYIYIYTYIYIYVVHVSWLVYISHARPLRPRDPDAHAPRTLTNVFTY